MLRGGMLPPVPEVLQGVELKIEFVSILTQMQRMVGLGQIERALGFAGNIAGAFPQALDKVDIDAAMDEYFERAGVPPKIKIGRAPCRGRVCHHVSISADAVTLKKKRNKTKQARKRKTTE